MEMRRRMPIGVELVKRGIVTENDIEKALEYQRERPNTKLGDILHILDACDGDILIQNIVRPNRHTVKPCFFGFLKIA